MDQFEITLIFTSWYSNVFQLAEKNRVCPYITQFSLKTVVY